MTGYMFNNWLLLHELLQRQHALRHRLRWTPEYVALLDRHCDALEPEPDGPLWTALVDAVLVDAAGGIVPSHFRARVDELLRAGRGHLVPALVAHVEACGRTEPGTR